MQKFISAIFLGLITGSLFLTVLDHGFVWEDQTTIVDNEAVNPPSFEGVLEQWTSSDQGRYTPVPESLWYLGNRVLNGPGTKVSPKIMHGMSLMAHVGATIAVFLILCFFVRNIGATFCGALLYGVHPLQVESVALVTNAHYLYAACFGFLAVWQYLLFVGKKPRQHRRNSRGSGHLWIAFVLYGLAVFSAPAIGMLLFVIPLLEAAIPRENTLMRSDRQTWPWFVFGLLSLVAFLPTVLASSVVGTDVAFWQRPLVLGDALAFYLSKILVPWGIGPDYGRSPHFVFSHWWGFMTWMVPVLVVLVLMFWREKQRTLYALAAGAFALLLLPFLGVFLFKEQAMSTVADRYVYAAMFGPALALAHLIATPKKVVAPLVGVVSILVFGWMSWQQQQVWESDKSLWSHSLNINTNSPVAHRALGDEARKAKDWQKARKHYEIVLESNNVDPDIHFYLAEIARQEERNQTAIRLYARVLELDPEYAKVFYSYGLVLLTEEQPDAALVYFRKAREHQSGDPRPAWFLGKTLAAKGEIKEAIPFLLEALEKDNSAAKLGKHRAATEALLGRAFFDSKEWNKAQGYLESAVGRNKEDANSHKMLADIYYEDGLLDKAREHYSLAAEKFATDPELFFRLGIIAQSNKKHKDAIGYFETAGGLDSSRSDVVLKTAVSNFYLRQFKLATEQFENALGMNKNIADAHYYLGDMARWAGKTDVALSHYYRALKIDKLHSDSHYRLGNYFMDKDRVRQAIGHYQSALKSAPEDSRILGKLNRAKRALEKM